MTDLLISSFKAEWMIFFVILLYNTNLTKLY